MRKLRILVAPLDWGLGHATRCIPIIKELALHGCEITLAGEGAQEILLKKEFPALQFLSLPGYRIQYAGGGYKMAWKILRQIPELRKTIQNEKKWLKKNVIEFGFDAVISDNRYGLYHKNIPCVFITHQLLIKSPWKWTEKIIQKQNYSFINQFTECWIPDNEGPDNFAGALSHPAQMPNRPVYYTGPLSRFRSTGLPEKPNYLLIILSGPEPQRSIFENIIISQISDYKGTATIVRGLPGTPSLIPSTDSIHFYNHLCAEELNIEMEKAAFVIARSGYSTLMDAMALNKKCILVPTPGQTEQEYLAKYFAKKGYSIFTSQTNFSLNEALIRATNFSYNLPFANSGNKLKQSIDRFISSL